MLNGLQNFLQFINDNWTTIIIIIGLCVSLYVKIKNYLNKSTEERISIAKEQLKQVILKMITDAEEDYENWNKAGSVKRSQVIKEIFEKYPILSRVVDQTTLIEWIDTEIDYSLKILKKIVQQNEEVISS